MDPASGGPMSSSDSSLIRDRHSTESSASLANRCGTAPANGSSTVIRGQRTVARFRAEPLPADYLEAILRLVSQAPFEGHRDRWRFIVIQDVNARARLQWTHAPVVLIAFTLEPACRPGTKSDLRETSRVADERNGNGSYPGHVGIDMDDMAPSAQWMNRQRGIALQTMMLVAEAYGVGAEPVQCFDPEDLKLQFGIPSEARVVALLAMGFAEEDPDAAPPPQVDLQDFVYVERYGRPWIG